MKSTKNLFENVSNNSNNSSRISYLDKFKDLAEKNSQFSQKDEFIFSKVFNTKNIDLKLSKRSLSQNRFDSPFFNNITSIKKNSDPSNVFDKSLDHTVKFLENNLEIHSLDISELTSSIISDIKKPLKCLKDHSDGLKLDYQKLIEPFIDYLKKTKLNELDTLKETSEKIKQIQKNFFELNNKAYELITSHVDNNKETIIFLESLSYKIKSLNDQINMQYLK